jgi:hypothetical protein
VGEAEPASSGQGAAPRAASERPAAASPVLPQPFAGEQDHLQRLQRILACQQQQHERRRRGWPGQRLQRELEQMVRQQCVHFRIVTAEQGLTRAAAAEQLGLLPRTLRLWEQLQDNSSLQPLPRGRPVARSAVAQRHEVLAAIREVGPGIGVPTLREHFPDMARAELADLLRRSRRVWRQRQRQALRVLHW